MTKGHKTLDRGDIIFIDFDPSAGSEIMKRRPAIVISPLLYNKKSRLIICCPITSTIRNNPWEVLIPNGHEVSGVVLSNHLSTMDQYARRAEWKCRAPMNIIKDVLSKIQVLIL